MTTPTPDRTPTGDLRERLADALHQHTIATGLPTPFPPDFPEDPWLEAAKRADQARADAVLPVVEAERKRAIETERAAITKGVREYFAPVDDPLFEDVEVLCGRIERGEYGTA